MAFTNSSIQELLNSVDGDFMMTLLFDNDQIISYSNTDELNKLEFVQFGGEDFIKMKGFVDNKKTGRIDIPTTIYKPTDTLQSVLMLDDASDANKVDIRFTRMA